MRAQSYRYGDWKTIPGFSPDAASPTTSVGEVVIVLGDHRLVLERSDLLRFLADLDGADLLEVRARLLEVYLPEGVELWIDSPNPLLGGQRPIDLVRRGEKDRVLAAIAALADGVVV